MLQRMIRHNNRSVCLTGQYASYSSPAISFELLAQHNFQSLLSVLAWKHEREICWSFHLQCHSVQREQTYLYLYTHSFLIAKM